VLEKLKRGEIWPLPGGSTADEIVSVAQEMRMDFCFFDHCPGAPAKAHDAGLLTGAVVDGPWQRWMSEVGWEEAMLQMGHGTETLQQGLNRMTALARREIEEWAATDVEMILLADDVAYAGGPYMSPKQLEKYLLPLYSSLSASAKSAGKTAGFHCDGRVDLILPVLKQAEFQFYSIEPEGTDPIRAWSVLDAQVPLLSGLPTAWLSPGGFLPAQEGKILREWLSAGPLIVTSACGLYHAEAKAALREIYLWMDL
jgi:hypothetical protein